MQFWRAFHMRKILGSVILFLFINSSFASPNIVLEPSFILGLWGFAAGSSSRVRSEVIDNVYKNSAYRTKENDERFSIIHEIISKYFQEGYEFHGKAPGRSEQSWDVMEHFEYQAARSASLEEFRTRTQGVIPTYQHQVLFKSLAALKPVYDDLIWNKSHVQLAKDTNRLGKLVHSLQANEILKKQIQFYGANWDDSLPFIMKLTPIPAKSGATHATVVCDTGLVQVLKEEKNIEGRFGVLIHEIGHSLYSTETPEFQQKMAEWFLKSSVPTAKIAYEVWEEMLSTVTGNGWAFEKSAGHIDKDEWYNNKEYNELSKAMYPMAKSYLENGKTVDESFAQNTIAKFQELFPDAPRRNRRLLKHVMLVTDGTFGPNSELKKKILDNRRWIHSVNYSAPLNAEETIKAVQNRTENEALILLLKPSNSSQLKNVEKNFPEIGTFSKFVKNKPGYAFMIDERGRLDIIVETADPDALEKVMSKFNADESTESSPAYYSL